MPVEKTCIAVEFASATLSRDRDLAATGFAVLGVIVGRKHFHFLNCVRIYRNVCAAIVTRVHVRSAIDGELMLVGPRSVYVEGINSACSSNLTVEVADDARNHLEEVEDISPVQRKIVDLFARDQVGTFAGIRLQLKPPSIGRYRDRGISGAHL